MWGRGKCAETGCGGGGGGGGICETERMWRKEREVWGVFANNDCSNLQTEYIFSTVAEDTSFTLMVAYCLSVVRPNTLSLPRSATMRLASSVYWPFSGTTRNGDCRVMSSSTCFLSRTAFFKLAEVWDLSSSHEAEAAWVSLEVRNEEVT